MLMIVQIQCHKARARISGSHTGLVLDRRLLSVSKKIAVREQVPNARRWQSMSLERQSLARRF